MDPYRRQRPIRGLIGNPWKNKDHDFKGLSKPELAHASQVGVGEVGFRQGLTQPHSLGFKVYSDIYLGAWSIDTIPSLGCLEPQFLPVAVPAAL